MSFTAPWRTSRCCSTCSGRRLASPPGQQWCSSMVAGCGPVPARTWPTRRGSWRRPATSLSPSTTASSTSRPGGTRWPAQLDDVQHAVRWVRANAARYGVDPERVGAYGWSAGGQLAALLGTRDTRNAASPRRHTPVAWRHLRPRRRREAWPPTRVHPLSDVAWPSWAATAAQVPERYRERRHSLGSTRGPLPSGRHGALDDVVPVAQSRRLVSALRATGVEVEYVELPDAGHGDLGSSRVGPATLAFLGRHLRLGDSDVG